MVISEITLYNTLKEKLGDQVAQVVVESIKETVKEEVNNKKRALLQNMMCLKSKQKS